MPIIASATGESKRIIEEAECGVCCAIGDAKALAQEIEGLMKLSEAETRAMGKHARAFCEERFDKSKLMNYMERYFE